jgi:hypothetical protein
MRDHELAKGLQYPFVRDKKIRIHIPIAVTKKIIVFRDVNSSTLKMEATDYISHPRPQQMLKPISEIST